MIHYTCDRCSRPIDPVDEIRYVVRMEVCSVFEESEEEQDADDRDHLMEVHEILEREDEFDDEHVEVDVYRKLRFDLCSECYRRFSKNPIGKQRHVKSGFSEN